MVAVPTATRSLGGYREHAGENSIREILHLAKPLKGTRILHLSTTPPRPQVSQTVSTLASLLKDLGMKVDWHAIRSADQFTPANKPALTPVIGHADPQTVGSSNRLASRRLIPSCHNGYDFVIVHDLDLAWIRASIDEHCAGEIQWIWHCHTDISHLAADAWREITRQTTSYAHRFLALAKQRIVGIADSYSVIPPVIDPLDLTNRELPNRFVETALRYFGINAKEPFVLCSTHDAQASSLSTVIDGFLRAKEQLSALRLVILTPSSARKPSLIAECLDHKLKSHRDILALPFPEGIGALALNALQRAAVTVIESDEGPSDVRALLSAMWKERPVIFGEATAAQLGIEHGKNGYIAHKATDLARQIIRLAESHCQKGPVVQRAKQYVRDNFLITSLLRDYLSVMTELAARRNTRLLALAR